MTNPFNSGTPIGFLLTVLGARLDQRRDERGASAVEWVIIAAIVVAIAIAVGLILENALRGEANEIRDKIRSA